MKIIIPLLLLILCLRLGLFYAQKSTLKDGEHVMLVTTLLTDPIQEGRYQRLSLVLDHGEHATLRTNLYPRYHYGQTLRIEGDLRMNQVRENKKFGTLFNQVITSDSVAMTIIPSRIQIEEKRQNGLLAVIYLVRQNIASLYESVLSSTQASLLMGIVFGIKQEMPDQLTEALRSGGVLHVIAASGMNVTLLAGAVSSILGRMLKRQLAIVATLGILVFYAVFSGLSASILRASVMAGLAFIAQLLGRQYLAWYGLMLTGWIMLFISPMLLGDIGFQLSFCATLGIMGMSFLLSNNPPLQSFLGRVPIGEDIVTTLGAQLTTLPIMLSSFGTYSIISIAVNAFVLWTIPLLMILGASAAGIGLFLPVVGKGVLYLAMPLLQYFEQVVYLFAGVQLGIVVDDGIPWQLAVGYYCCLIAFFLLCIKRYAKKDRLY